MVAPLSAGLALRDAFLAAGLGLSLCAVYRVLRLLLGNGKLACFVCDVLVCVLAAVLYRAAATGLFAAGVIRWYTLAALVCGYAAFQKLFSPGLTAVRAAVCTALVWPWKQLCKWIILPIFRAFCRLHAHVRENRLARRKKKKQRPGKCKKDLPNTQTVLYNSQ